MRKWLLGFILAFTSSPVLAQSATPVEQTLPAVVSEALEHRLKLKIGQETYQVDFAAMLNEMPPEIREGLDPREEFLTLPQADQVKFLAWRRTILKRVAQALHATRGAVSAGFIAGDKVAALVKSVSEVDGPIDERRRKLIETVLAIVDHRLWMQGPTVFERTEYTMELGIAAVGQAGLFGKYEGGGAIGFGFAFGINVKTKTFVFEIYRRDERLSEWFMPFIQAGVKLRAGVAVDARPVAMDALVPRIGLGLPTVVYLDESPGRIATGLEYMVGLPRLLRTGAGSNRFERTVKWRIEFGIAPLFNGVEAAAFLFRGRWMTSRRRSCGQVFL